MFWKKPLMAEYILLTLLEKLRTNGNLKKTKNLVYKMNFPFLPYISLLKAIFV